ncbi:MAG TPA: aspartate--tRNA ligase [Dehalococcoidia bacterium]|nr:aspartate--tRNA ligase [Dehalococcoidia bacterium]
MLKTQYCGDLRASDEGREVVLAGWVHRRRDHGGLIFIDLRDSRGLAQVVFHPEQVAAHAVASEARGEYVLRVAGTVQRRRAGTENEKLPTGAIEVRAAEAWVLNAAKTPPFYINEESDTSEATRLRYRYLDLRRERLHENIVLRHRIIAYIRRFLTERSFIEIETPVLANPTPEGARDYLVPSRVHPGSFYALPQSPQQFKQLLMVAGFERYFQIARCYRDEDLRADRQPEFTQLDLEMSFVEQDDILELMEQLYLGIAGEVRPDLIVPAPFPRITYAESLRRFGTDKPDLRYGLELTDFTNAVRGTEFVVFKGAVESGGAVEGLCVPGGAAFSRKEIDALTETVKGVGARGLVSIAFDAAPASAGEAEIRSAALKHLGLEMARSIGAVAGAGAGDLVLLVAGQGGVPAKDVGSAARVKPALDALRRTVAAKLKLADPQLLRFAFVIDAPLVEWDDEGERWSAVHHMFTSVKDEDLGLLDSDPGSVRSNQYDLTCNGWEIGSGSIRIHQRELQARIFKLLGISDEDARVKFGHMLEAFEYGAPPHGGMAPGIDRTVALFAQETDIRETIAFPKTKSATDLMTGAPSAVDQAALDAVGLTLKPEAASAE